MSTSFLIALTVVSVILIKITEATITEDLSQLSPSEPSAVSYCTLKSGAPIGDKQNSLLVGPKGPSLLADVAFIEEAAHFNRERIPERVVHAKGAAAFGEFVVTNTLITKYTKASLFSTLDKRTPVAVRFSQVTGESGYPDTVRDVRGFSVRFKTDEGNWDIVGNNLPVFFIRDPINFVSFIHSQKRHPKTHVKDPDAFWDFISSLPESMHTTIMLFSERGIPDGYRHMHGYGVNTFKLVNKDNQAFYAKFHWITNQGIRNLDPKIADTIAGTTPDYAMSDLYNAIMEGKYPSWTLKAQIIPIQDAEKANFNVFDATKTWPYKQFPLIEIGRMTLQRNQENYFAEVEQLAFSPANMIPGIEGSPDKMLMGRMFSYADTQRYRLGVNYADLPVNRPVIPVVTPTYNDGRFYTTNVSSTMPNYVPSIKYENLKTQEQFVEHPQKICGNLGRYSLAEDDNFSQARVLVKRVLSKESREALALNIADHLKNAKNDIIVAKVIALFREIDIVLAESISNQVAAKRPGVSPEVGTIKKR